MPSNKENAGVVGNQALQKSGKGGKGVAKKAESPRSLKIAERGIKTSHDFADLMSALMSDLIDGRVAPNVGNSTCNAGGKLLRVVELQYKYGTASPDGTKKSLVLAVGQNE